MTRTVTVIDVGGTHIRWGSWSAEGGLICRQRLPTPSFRSHAKLSVPQLQKLLIEAIAVLPPNEEGALVGVSFGAAIDHINGTVYASAPLWGSHNTPFDLQGALSRSRADVRWHVVNDVTAALLHVVSLPLCMRDKKVMLVMVSTGIAVRTICRKTMKIPFDASGLQGEIGHIPVTASLCDQPVILNCDCGEPGHLSAYSSGPGIAQMAEILRKRYPQEWSDSALGGRIADGEPFEDAFRFAVIAGDCIATTLLNAVTAPVADVLRITLCLAPDVDRIVLTGGVAVSLGQHYKAAIMTHLQRQGIYITSQYHPDWIEDRIVIFEAECLVGAGNAALVEMKK